MVLAGQCLVLQFFKNGQKRYFSGFQPTFSRIPDMMESFVFSPQPIFGNTSITQAVTILQ